MATAEHPTETQDVASAAVIPSVWARRRRFNVDEYYKMAEAGILKRDERVELIDGDILVMSPIGSPHAACVDRLNDLLLVPTHRRANVGIQGPLRLGDHDEPEPDVQLLKYRADFYGSAHPGPDDVLLLVEVMVTSASDDRTLKLGRYARSNVAEVWLVDLNSEVIEVYRRPADGSYAEKRRRRRGENVSPAVFPDVVIGVDAILG